MPIEFFCALCGRLTATDEAYLGLCPDCQDLKPFAACEVCGHPIEVGDFAVAAHGVFFCSVECEQKYEEGLVNQHGITPAHPCDGCALQGSIMCVPDCAHREEES